MLCPARYLDGFEGAHWAAGELLCTGKGDGWSAEENGSWGGWKGLGSAEGPTVTAHPKGSSEIVMYTVTLKAVNVASKDPFP